MLICRMSFCHVICYWLWGQHPRANILVPHSWLLKALNVHAVFSTANFVKQTLMVQEDIWNESVSATVVICNKCAAMIVTKEKMTWKLNY